MKLAITVELDEKDFPRIISIVNSSYESLPPEQKEQLIKLLMSKLRE